MSHDEYVKRRNEIAFSYTGQQLRDAIDELVLELARGAKPAEYQAESWQQGLEKKAFDNAVQVYEYKLTAIVKGDI